MEKKTKNNQIPTPSSRRSRYIGMTIVLGLLLIVGASVYYWYFYIHTKPVENPDANFDATAFYSQEKYRWEGASKEKKDAHDSASPPKDIFEPCKDTLKDGSTWEAHYNISANCMKMKRDTQFFNGSKKEEYFTLVPVDRKHAAGLQEVVNKSHKKDEKYFGSERIYKKYGKSAKQAEHYITNTYAAKHESNIREYNVVLYSTDNKNFKAIGIMSITPSNKDKGLYNAAYFLAHPEVSQVKGAGLSLLYGLKQKWFKHGKANKIVLAIHKDNTKSLNIAKSIQATATTREALDKDGFKGYNEEDDVDDDRLDKHMRFFVITPNKDDNPEPNAPGGN